MPPTIHTIVKKKVRLFFFKTCFCIKYSFISTLLIYNIIIQSKARLMFINVFFLLHTDTGCIQTFFTYYVSTMKKHECDWVLNVATCTEWPVMAKHQNILIWRNFFHSLNDKWLLLKWPTIPQMMWHICGIECFNKANPLFEQYW